MVTAYIISTGTELLLGDTVDTNCLFISRRLAALGIRLVGRSTVGDNAEMIKRAFLTGLQAADIIISSGGMGPTSDDLTREMGCEALGVPLELHEIELEKIKDYFARRRRDMPEINRKQALFPPGAVILDNAKGTAPGFLVEKDDKTVFFLPGPPREMEPIFLGQVETYLRRLVKQAGRVSFSRTVKVMGPGESQVEDIIAEVMRNPQGCAMALLAKEGEVHIRVSGDGDSEEVAAQAVNTVVDRVKDLLGRHVYGEEDATLAGVAVSLLAEQGRTVAAAESCTGGLVGKLITDVAGSSDVFWGGAVSYSNEAKLKILGVKQETLDSYGAVSPQTAQEMARGIRKLAGSDYGLAITGIAGPGGGSDSKPVGLVYLGLASAQGSEARECRFLGDREAIRVLSAKSALDWLRRTLGSEV